MRRMTILGLMALLASLTAPSPQALPAAAKAKKVSTQLSAIPKLEVKQLSGDFEKWGTTKTIYAPEVLQLRWGKPITATPARWEIATAPFPGGTIVRSGQLPTVTVTSPSQMQYFTIHLDSLPDSIFPPAPPATPKKYYLRIVPPGKTPSPTVIITYKRNASSTTFTDLGLDPNMLNPLRIFVDLDSLHIHKADEEGDEEPYLINMVLYFDGTTINVLDLPNSTVRVSASTGTHGNVPQYNGSIGSGDTIALPDSTGYFQKTIRPINPELADVNLFGRFIQATDLTKASHVVVISIALEEDATSTEAARAARTALVGQVRTKLNEVLQGLTLAELIPLINGGNPLDLIPNPNQAICDQIAALNIPNLDISVDCRPGWALLVDQIVHQATDIAIAEELSDYDLFENLASGIDHDDFIGVGVAVFNMEELRTAKRPLPITFMIEKQEPGSYPQAGATIVRYEVTGQIGRCWETQESAPCTPYYAPFMYNGTWVNPLR